MAFTTSKQVRFGEVDHARVVYFPRIFDFLHVAMEEFFEHEVHVPYRVVVEEWRVGFPTVRVETDFAARLLFGDELAIEMAFLALGRSSVRTRYRVRRLADEPPAVATLAIITTACVDLDTFTPRAIPPALREVFTRHLVDGDEAGGAPPPPPA